jgi:hypothetical protein
MNFKLILGAVLLLAALVFSVQNAGAVDVRFDGNLPPICSLLRAGEEQQIVFEVVGSRNSVGRGND